MSVPDFAYQAFLNGVYLGLIAFCWAGALGVLVGVITRLWRP